MIILRKKNKEKKKRRIKVTVGQLLKLFPEIKLLCKAAKKDFDSILGSGNHLPSYLYYCGITNDPKQRASQHNTTFLECIDVGSRSRAYGIEIAMNGLGFDTGKRPANGGKKDSTFVYIYRKIEGTTIEITEE